MSNLSQFFGTSRPTTSIVNDYSAGGKSSVQVRHDSASGGGSSKRILSGALTAATYKEILAITGAGAVNFLNVLSVNATARTLGLKVVVDGVTVFDAVSNSISAVDSGMIAVGWKQSSANYDVGEGYMPFTASLSVQVKSSLSETDFVAIETSYVTYA